MSETARRDAELFDTFANVLGTRTEDQAIDRTAEHWGVPRWRVEDAIRRVREHIREEGQ
jgi:hypothetical protein